MKKLMIFVMGAAVGSAVTWKLLKDKYAQMAQEEINSVREAFSRRQDEPKDDSKIEDTESNEKVEEESYNNDNVYKKILKKNGYTNYSEKYQIDDKTEEKEVEEMKVKKDVEKPYIITPDEFGEIYGYECFSLFYFDDGVLTDDMYDLVDDIDEIVGLDSLNHFGEYEDDSVFVRNDRLKCDYEILICHRNYSELIETMPYIIKG